MVSPAMDLKPVLLQFQPNYQLRLGKILRVVKSSYCITVQWFLWRKVLDPYNTVSRIAPRSTDLSFMGRCSAGTLHVDGTQKVKRRVLVPMICSPLSNMIVDMLNLRYVLKLSASDFFVQTKPKLWLDVSVE
jgi:hypothetical protein